MTCSVIGRLVPHAEAFKGEVEEGGGSVLGVVLQICHGRGLDVVKVLEASFEETVEPPAG